jgi:hypothetical protein
MVEMLTDNTSNGSNSQQKKHRIANMLKELNIEWEIMTEGNKVSSNKRRIGQNVEWERMMNGHNVEFNKCRMGHNIECLIMMIENMSKVMSNKWDITAKVFIISILLLLFYSVYHT